MENHKFEEAPLELGVASDIGRKLAILKVTIDGTKDFDDLNDLVSFVRKLKHGMT